jgi:hypothetical protein
MRFTASRYAQLSAALVGGLLLSSQARAQDDDGWRVSLTPYVWAAGLKGDLGAILDAPPTPVDAEYPGLFEFSGAFMGLADVGYGRFGVLGDIDYLKISGDHSRANGNVALSGEIETALTLSTVAGYWRAYDGDAVNVDVLVGGRYTQVELEVDLQLNDRKVTGNRQIDWWDTVVGARATGMVSDHISLTGYGDVGISENPVWQVYGGGAWHFNDNFAATVGYRYYSVEFSTEKFDYNAAAGGPVFGLTFSF